MSTEQNSKNSERRLFGTDGIRGVANRDPMTSEMALQLGRAIARAFHEIEEKEKNRGFRVGASTKGHRHRILIGKDTRLSGYMLETALASGICSMGVDVLLVGPLPTPGVAFLTRSMRAEAGVVISASHNYFEDNGIKFFSGDGFKLPDAIEARMEEMIFNGELNRHRPTAGEIGKAFRISDALGRYIVFLKNTFPRHLTLDGLKIVVDCAHGAAYRVAPDVLSELGAEVISIGVQPDGENINRNCGALHPETARQVLLARGADLAVCLDGDGDRAIFIDEKGEVLDGDHILALCARELCARGLLKEQTVVATVMSNLGLQIALQECGIGLVQTAVGDRYVVEEMLRGGYNLGGEQSGHIVFLDHNTTGDGCVTFLQVLAIMIEQGKPLSELGKVMTKFPQVLINVRVREKKPLADIPTVKEKIARVEKALGERGRLLVRYSGTEPLARVMLEGENEAEIREMAEDIADEIRLAVGEESS
ncbi:MAG TPA: phosphoglucosamine mutase [Candidatus Acidoferrales bacterium]|nr:phosphoglucosamine mutase [Candidatus Acidoferrales bacterium]